MYDSKVIRLLYIKKISSSNLKNKLKQKHFENFKFIKHYKKKPVWRQPTPSRFREGAEVLRPGSIFCLWRHRLLRSRFPGCSFLATQLPVGVSLSTQPTSSMILTSFWAAKTLKDNKIQFCLIFSFLLN